MRREMSLWTKFLQLMEPLARALLAVLAFIVLLRMCQGVGVLHDESHPSDKASHCGDHIVGPE